MSKIAFIFPGQGAQYVGMGKDFYDAYEEAREVYRKAKEATGLDIEALCFTENDKLNITEYTQIAMLTTEVALLKVLESKGVHADVCAGLSLGEYGALAAAGVMELESLFQLIRLRGIYMQEAYPVGGAMTAVLGLDAGVIESTLKGIAGIVSIANYNCPGQLVISGNVEAVKAACEKLKAAGAKRALLLPVGGAFHSPLMQPAKDELQAAIEATTFNTPKCAVYQNVDAQAHTDAEEIKANLIAQLTASVRWTQEVQNMIAAGATDFTECGPGKVLQGMIGKIAKGNDAVTAHGIQA
mgnify:CR=1 FL=1